MVKEAERKIAKEKTKKKRSQKKVAFCWATGSSKTADRNIARTKRALRENDARDTRRTKKKWQGGMGKRSRVFVQLGKVFSGSK